MMMLMLMAILVTNWNFHAGLAGSKKEATNKQLTFFEQLMGQGKSGNEDDKQGK